MKETLTFLSLILLISCSVKNNSKAEKFLVSNYSVDNITYYVVLNSKNDTVFRLNPDKYWVCFDDTVENYLVVAPKDRKGWWAIDFNENFLFEVYNISDGEPSPDELNSNRIRIVDKSGRIGFADEKGRVVIQPKYEQVTAFYNDHAIIGANCEKIPWDTIHLKGGCNHYTIQCAEYGYIDKNGNIIEFGNYTFEELWKKLNFTKE